MHKGDPRQSSPVIQLSGLAPSWTDKHVRLVLALFGGAVAVRFPEGNESRGERIAQALLRKPQPENIARIVWQLNNAVVGDNEFLEECTLSCHVVANSNFFEHVGATGIPSVASHAPPVISHAPVNGSAAKRSNRAEVEIQSPDRKKLQMSRFFEQQEVLLQRLSELGQRQAGFVESQTEEQQMRTEMMRQMSRMLEQHSQQQSELVSLVKPLSLSDGNLRPDPQVTLNHAANGADPGPGSPATKVAPAEVSQCTGHSSLSSEYSTNGQRCSPSQRDSKTVNSHNVEEEGEDDMPFSLWHFLTYKNQTSVVSIILLLTYLATGIVFYVGFEGWAVGDTLYFAVVVMTTVGYGDFLPETDHAKLFTCFYAMFGLVIAACAVSNISDAITAWAASKLRAKRKECMFEQNMKKKQRRRRALLEDIGYFVSLLLIGMNFFVNAKDWEGDGAEGNIWVNSLYLSVITLTTIGFGDFAATSDLEKGFTVLYMVVGIPVCATCLQALTSVVFGKHKDTIKLHLIRGGASPDNFHRMLKFREHLNREIGCTYNTAENCIDRFQFLACVLIQNGLLEMEHIKRAMHSFEHMDAERDGVITIQDVEKTFRKTVDSAQGSLPMELS